MFKYIYYLYVYKYICLFVGGRDYTLTVFIYIYIKSRFLLQPSKPEYYLVILLCISHCFEHRSACQKMLNESFWN